MVKIPEEVKELLAVLRTAGHEAWCVGGCVRDSLLGRTPYDWDVTTSARPEETLRLFPKRGIPTGLRHGTVTVRTDQGPVEITTYRVDGTYHDHRRPDQVTFTRSLEEDLRRRDFTINAMALGLNGEIRDPFGGQEDLKNAVLRCVGDPERRFQEDALRILRGIRFASTRQLTIEQETAAAIHRNRNLLLEIAPERILTELRKLLCGKAAAEILREYPDVVGVFWPEILPMIGFDHRNLHHCYDVWEHTLHALDAVEPDFILRCTMLLHDIGKPNSFTVDEAGIGHFYGHPRVSAELAEGMLHRLRCDNETRRAIVRLVEWHDRNIPRTKAGIRRALRSLGKETFLQLLAVKRADNLAQAPACQGIQKEIDLAEEIFQELLAEGACFSLKQMAVNGWDLMQLGFRGAEIGTTLNQLLDAVVDGKLENQKVCLLEYARNLQK